MDKSTLAEFNMSESEVDQDLQVGDIGTITIPVVVVSKANGQVRFRKTDTANVDSGFRKETLDEMRKRIIDENDKPETPTKDDSKE